MVKSLVVVLVPLIAGALVWAFWIAPNLEKKRLESANSAAHVAASLVTAIAILTAGVLYLLERQWSPRFGVELKTETHPLPAANRNIAVVQATVAITNLGRTSQHIESIEIGVAGLEQSPNETPNEFGDLPGPRIYHFFSRPKDVDAGETDLGYFEVPVNCRWSLVRVVVKVPQPSRDNAPLNNRPVYQRKALVSLADACAATAK